ncbi:MAG: hypothetical protein WC554_10635 [Clostridia bacterium]
MKPKIYVSHSIRGKYGVKATPEQMEENNQKAISFGQLLKANYPKINWYVPGEHDEFVKIAYLKKYLTDTQILDVDCDILAKCNGLLVWMPDNYISGGMQVEVDYAIEHKIPICYLNTGNVWNNIDKFLEGFDNE